MHPYRTPWPLEPAPRVPATSGGTAIAFAVLGFTGAVQIVLSFVEPNQPPAYTAAGVTAVIAAFGWFARARRRMPDDRVN